MTWSAKGKQLAVGREDASIALFKPDLTPVRTIERPPVNEVGAITSLNWFTNTEFFISYELNSKTPGNSFKMSFDINTNKLLF